MKVVFKINGVRNNNGFIRGLAFTDPGTGFPEGIKKATGEAEAKASKGSVIITFDIPTTQRGAFTFFHDEQDQKVLKKSLLGIPKSGIAITNWGGLFKPNYEKSCIKLKVGTENNLSLKYF